MSEFLLEVGLEEVPAAFLPRIREELEAGFHARLGEERIPFASIDVHYTLRRWSVHVAGLAERQPDREEDVVGPPRSAALTATGEPTKAAAGFARSRGVALEQCRILTTPKGEYFGFRQKIEGAPVPHLLPGICGDVLSRLSFPKSMRWGAGSAATFVRPVRWIVALFDGAMLDFEFAGVRASNLTRLDRFRAAPAARVTGWTDYLDRLRAAGIVLDAADRRKIVREQLDREAAAAGGRWREDPALLETVADLVESPLVVRGSFDDKFRELPQEILMTSMREHQKQFAVLDSAGRQMPVFLAVADAVADPEGHIRRGNERVLRARLEDARFFWSDDARMNLVERSKRLDRVLFQHGLGSYADKCGRLEALVEQLSKAVPAAASGDTLATAARLCKADLTTDMVKEFTSLQGIVGGLYARREGYLEPVWQAIYDHYRPISAEDATPATSEGCLLSLADRLDTIAGSFGLGRVPTGSRDPLGLRRLGQGCVQICIERGWSLSLREAFCLAYDGYAGGTRFERAREDVLTDFVEFIDARLRFAFERDFGYDIVNAVIRNDTKDAADMHHRLRALESFISSGDFLALATAFKRIKNILRDAPPSVVDPSGLEQPEERALYEAFTAVRGRVEALLARLDYEHALAEIAALRLPVDRFFEKVLVMDEDPRRRSNRLGLLRSMADLFLTVADFSEIDTEERLRRRAEVN